MCRAIWRGASPLGGTPRSSVPSGAASTAASRPLPSSESRRRQAAKHSAPFAIYGTIPTVTVCGRCGRENEPTRETCVRCGSVLGQAPPQEGTPEQPQHHCHWHPKTATDLGCGRCGKFVCPKCVRLGPAGPRCKECARSGVSLRPAGLAHEAKVTARRWFGASPWLTIVVVLTLMGVLSRLVGNCQPRQAPPPPEQAEAYGPGD